MPGAKSIGPLFWGSALRLARLAFGWSGKAQRPHKLCGLLIWGSWLCRDKTSAFMTLHVVV
jgi:hypothetical protein